MYEIEYNPDVKKYGIYRVSPYSDHKLLCCVKDSFYDALLYVVETIGPFHSNCARRRR